MQNQRFRRHTGIVLAILMAFSSTHLLAQEIQQEEPEWLKRSNETAYQVLQMSSHFVPEFSGQQGIEGLDEEIFDLGENLYERQQAIEEEKLVFLQGKLEGEEDPRVIQDIEIMIKATRDNIESNRINNDSVLPYGNLAGIVFFGLSGLLDKQVPAERQKAALVRLKKYNGQADGYMPLTELAQIRFAEAMEREGLIQPFAGEVAQDLERAPQMLAGIPGLFQASGLEGWEDDLALLRIEIAKAAAPPCSMILPGSKSKSPIVSTTPSPAAISSFTLPSPRW